MLKNLLSIKVVHVKKNSHFSQVKQSKKTNLDTFKNFGLYEGKKVIENLSQSSSLAGFLEQIKFLKEDVTIQPIFRAWAGASGIITDETYKYFEKKLTW